MRLFATNIYEARRKHLAANIKSGLILIMGNGESAMNYTDNVYPFRQNSNFLYYFGINAPELNALIDADSGEAVIYGHELTMDDIIWVGEVEKLSALAAKVGVSKVKDPASLKEDINKALTAGRLLHYLPTYRIEHHGVLKGLDPQLSPSASLITSVVAQRSVKEAVEIEEMTKAVEITRNMHLQAMKTTKSGKFEYEVVAEILRQCKSEHAGLSYGIIFSVNGQVLHNHHHENLMESGRMIINDSGAENDMCYAGDITRSFPVSGKFTAKQKDIYQIVLEMEKTGINMVEPGIRYIDVHKAVNKLMLTRFKEMGLVQGDVDAMLEQGVSGLFMPHGLGHMIGLDVHDMEDLGESYVGYEYGQQRSDKLGLKSLRLARKLQPGFTLTVEPGIYFIPQLIEKYKSEGKFADFVNYDALTSYYDFGGIRVEDNVLITEEGRQVLGTYIPKEIEEIEAIMA
ncbi:MAG: aminopeptidase P family protein [Saprospiraceae bacterium]|nr:aminopeptidase P family protein [Saprospiraceae bacterium]